MRPERVYLIVGLALVSIVTTTVLKPLTGPLRADDVDSGKQQFLTSRGTCHAADNGAGNRQGPNLFGVYSRRVGDRADFKYSDALKNGTWTWTEVALDRWIENAQDARPGTIMNYRQAILPNAE